jgi:phosphopantothenoylcysteine decarboxylase/phosphopantothenate--cysteine ligase
MRVLLGVTGGIAAYKATSIIRLLTEAGHDVQVLPTQNALRFIGRATLEALSHNAVDPDLFTDVESVKHVELGKSADLIIVAPATAAFLARLANGVADDLLLNTLMVSKAPVLIAPAMHTEMWDNAATRANVGILVERGFNVIEPSSGRLTGADIGVGRLPEPEDIVAAALKLVAPQDLSGQKLLITAGGTLESIDPVRYIGNRSSGKQGLAIAEAAKARGARVTMVAANIEVPDSLVDEVVQVESAAEMQSAVLERLRDHTVLVMTAAVADFRVANASDKKLKRSEVGSEIQLQLVANPDILASATALIAEQKLNCRSVGFAAETANNDDHLVRIAQQKLLTKNCDFLVANDVSGGAVFGSDQNRVVILTRSGRAVAREGSKLAVANGLLDLIAAELG